MSLISKHTIKADDIPPAAHDYELTLTFKVTQYGSPVDPDLATALNRIFHDWEEGRHPFTVEMVTEGLCMSIKNALYQCCQKRAQEKYGDEMVQMGPAWQGPGWRKSRWSIEAEKEFDELWKAGAYPGFCDQPNIKIERADDGRSQ
jgi:hypothetical protein